MSFVTDAVEDVMGFAGDIVGSVTGSKQQADAAKRAGDIQYRAAMAGIDEQRRQFDAVTRTMRPFVNAGSNAIRGMNPYVRAGESALRGQQALMGMLGPREQQAAIAALSASPEMSALIAQGENSMLQNASATGGLRGGNLQAALAQFRPQVLSSLINNQYARLGGMTALGNQTLTNMMQVGQASAANQASAGLDTGVNIANLLQQGGSARAGGEMASGSVVRNVVGDAINLAGIYYPNR